MKPIAPLMIEHRLIERMIAILERELLNIEKFDRFNALLIDYAVDFIRTYADQTHHGKEEDILFRELKKKNITPEHERIMNELIEEHKIGRKITRELVQANKGYIRGSENNISTIVEKIRFLIDFYPRHIEKEDKHFFVPVMHYFTEDELNAMLEEGHMFDRKMIHKKYRKIVLDFEKQYKIASKKHPDRINYL
jgi:hemerythrin-like domain-containing protein